MPLRMSRDDLIELLRRQGFSERILRAFARVPRELFVHPDYRDLAYEDTALPTKNGQTISQPSVIAEMLDALDVFPGAKVLEVGLGSGYVAALLSELGARVYGIERDPELCSEAQSRLKALGYSVRVRCGDGAEGWPEESPFDRLLISAAVPRIPAPLVEQLVDGGIVVAPVGSEYSQRIVAYVKRGDALHPVYVGSPVVFVPLRGRWGFR